MYKELSSNFSKKISRNRLQFVFRLAFKFRDGTEERSGDFIVQNRCQSNGYAVFCRPSNDQAEAQHPGPPTPPFTPTKKSCSMQPH